MSDQDASAPGPEASGNGSDGNTKGRLDDLVLPFRTERAGAMGRIVRLGHSIDKILSSHNYPEPVARVLGEGLVLAAMLGTTLKHAGRLTLQTSSDGPLRMMVVNFDAPGQLRGYASFDEALSESDFEGLKQGELLGAGHLALTVDPGGDLDRYQGIVALEGGTLSAAAHNYFHTSEQLPTYLRLTVAREFISRDRSQGGETRTSESDDRKGDISGEEKRGGRWHWRAGGLLVQFVASEGGKQAAKQIDNELTEDDDEENWQRTRLLAATVEDVELVDPNLASERLLFRLFHEEGVRVRDVVEIEALCRCSRERVEAFVKNFGAQELESLRDPDGSVTVTCEFCTAAYRFELGKA